MFFIPLVGWIVIIIASIWTIKSVLFIYYAQKALWELPYGRWLTTDDMLKCDIPAYIHKDLLLEMWASKIIEIQPKQHLTPQAAKRTSRGAYNAFTWNLYEFKLIIKPPRKRKRISLKEILKHFPGFEPPALPA